MRVGDVVRVKSIVDYPIGIVVSFDDDCGWPWVMIPEGKLVVFPAHTMEVVSEDR